MGQHYCCGVWDSSFLGESEKALRLAKAAGPTERAREVQLLRQPRSAAISLKGWATMAQGNALGFWLEKRRPERAGQYLPLLCRLCGAEVYGDVVASESLQRRR